MRSICLKSRQGYTYNAHLCLGVLIFPDRVVFQTPEGFFLIWQVRKYNHSSARVHIMHLRYGHLCDWIVGIIQVLYEIRYSITILYIVLLSDYSFTER